ncbi:MAG: hypothetical protein H6686_07245 [Fibrobacteria bacterium]|nr:hypothetical protein [Fibrobacteria bacterium]
MIRKFALVALLAVAGAHAGIDGVGYDGLLKQATVRLPLGENKLDLGVGFQQDSDADPKFQASLSAFLLVPWQSFEKLSLDFTGGAVFASKDNPRGDASFGLFAGLTPRAVIFDHLEVATRFGLDVPLAPTAKFRTAGQGVSIVEGLSFKVLF